MTQFDLMVLLTLEHPWENHGRGYRLRPDRPGLFSRIWRRLHADTAHGQPAGLTARAAERTPHAEPVELASSAVDPADTSGGRAA